MRINVYSEELTVEAISVKKFSRTGDVHTGAQLVLHTCPTYTTARHDDGSAVTFWMPKSKVRREESAVAFERMAKIFREAPLHAGLPGPVQAAPEYTPTTDCPDPAGCAQEGCNQNRDGSMCDTGAYSAESERQQADAQTLALLKECAATLAMWADVASAVSLREDILKVLESRLPWASRSTPPTI